jgi:Concanavalin A-like lectin/glucanases superfamily
LSSVQRYAAVVRVVILVALLAACGRVQFAPLTDAREDAANEVAVDALDPSLVLWLRMEDDPTDGRLDDSVGTHHATCAVPQCGAQGVGRVGNAVVLDAAQSEYYAIDPVGLPTGPFTVTFWAFIVNSMSGGFQKLVTKRYDTINNSWAVYIELGTNDFLYESAFGPPTTGEFHVLANPAPSGVWIHLAISWDGVTKRGYIDGVPVVNAAATIAFDSGEILLGVDIDDATFLGYFTGSLDELRIYDRRLSDAEIQLQAME